VFWASYAIQLKHTFLSFSDFIIRFLATRDSYKTIGHSFRMGFSTVSNIIKEVCEAINRKMINKYLPEPTQSMWKQSAETFLSKWNFLNAIGSIDGKHVTIKCPNNTGSRHFCYLKKFSVVLMAVVDADYKFVCVDIGGYGRNSDGGIFEASIMGQRFQNRTMNVPVGQPLPNQQEPTSYVLLGDEAFPLKPYLMRPFPYRQSRQELTKDMFNYRLCRARRVVENAFGILSKKFRIYSRPLEINVDTVNTVVLTTCILHNFLRVNTSGDTDYFEYIEQELQPDLNSLEILINDARRGSNEAFEVRNKFINWFIQNQL